MTFTEHFSRAGISATLSNTFGAELAYGAFLAAFGMTRQIKTNDQGVSLESELQQWTRYFCLIAAFSDEVTGLQDWQPPSLYADSAAIRDSSERFFKLADNATITAWVDVAVRVVQDTATIAPQEERGTGNPEEDFLARKGSASSDGLPIALPES